MFVEHLLVELERAFVIAGAPGLVGVLFDARKHGSARRDSGDHEPAERPGEIRTVESHFLFRICKNNIFK